MLIARHIDALNLPKDKQQSAYGVDVELLVYDQSTETAATDIAAWCTARNLPLKVLCNVAGLGGERDREWR